MKIVIAGASGLVGSALVPVLREGGHEVLRLVRRAARAPDEIEWDPAARQIEERKLEGVEAIVNLAGENVGAGRWTAERRGRILRSRVDSTRTLVSAVEKMERRPRVWLNASAVGIYGSRGDDVLTEGRGAGADFLAEVCRVWEAEAECASRLGVRTVRLRFGVVLSAEGGAMAKMLPVFRWGLGGRLGSGKQWMSWVGIEDAVRAIAMALTDERMFGAVNVVAPHPVTNAEFTRTLGRVLRRPAVMWVPAWALRVALGRMADETLLASQRAVPEQLNAWGFRFRAETVQAALRAAVK